jgi:hypothetical protein
MRKRSDYVVNFLVADDSEVDGDKSISRYSILSAPPQIEFDECIGLFSPVQNLTGENANTASWERFG